MSAPLKLPAILRLNVTEDDIRAGARGNAAECAFAKALKRMGFTGAFARHGRARVVGPGGVCVYDFGPLADAFMLAFDDGFPLHGHVFYGNRRDDQGALWED